MNPALLNKEEKANEAINNSSATEETKKEISVTTLKKVITNEEEPEVRLVFPKQFSKIVYLRWSSNVGALPGQNISDFIKKIGASYTGNATLRGLTLNEEKKLLPQILGVDDSSPEWENHTLFYWRNISKTVPHTGLELEIGLYYISKEDYEYDKNKAERDANGTLINHKGIPINLSDYILWRYCLKYSRVANLPEDIMKSPKIEFYLFSKDKEIKDKKATQIMKRKALQLLFSRTSERDWVDYVLRVMFASDRTGKYHVQDVEKMNDDEKDVLLQELVEEMPERFMAVAEDRNLQLKSFIEQCIAMGKLTRIANTDTITMESNTLGNSLSEVVAFLNNPKNAETLSILKAQVRLT